MWSRIQRSEAAPDLKSGLRPVRSRSWAALTSLEIAHWVPYSSRSRARGDAVDLEVAVLLVAELGVLQGSPVQEEDLEPAVFRPAHMGDEPGDGHQRGVGEDGPVGVLFGDPLAFPLDDRPLEVEPADELSTFVRREVRAVAGYGHERRG
ncbi:hypothetical protein GCM10020254_26280 [Streptomyces goshikiensis]